MNEIKIRSIEEQAVDYLKAIANNEYINIDYGLDYQAKVILAYIKKLQFDLEYEKENSKFSKDYAKSLEERLANYENTKDKR